MLRALGRIADGELHPLDCSVKSIAARAVVLGHGGAAVLSDVAAVIGGEDHRLRHWDCSFADLLAVDIKSDLSALAETAAGVGKLHAHLVFARGQRLRGFHVEKIHSRHVIAVLELAVLRVEAPAADVRALGDNHALGPVSGTSISAVTEWDLFFTFRTQFSDRRPMPPNSSWVFPLTSTGRPAVSGFIFSTTRSSIGNTLYRVASISHSRCSSWSFSGICLARSLAWLQSLVV